MKLVLVASNVAERGEWIEELRTRITPAKLLQSRAKTLAASSSDTVSVAELTVRMDALLIGDISSGCMGDLNETESPAQEVHGISAADTRIEKINTKNHLIDFDHCGGGVSSNFFPRPSLPSPCSNVHFRSQQFSNERLSNVAY